MSLLDKDLKNESTSEINWNPSEGWHEVRIIGVASIGDVPNKFKNGKPQPKIEILFAIDEFIDTPKGRVQKTKIDRYTASLHEKSSLVTKLLSPSGHSITRLRDLVGLTMRIKLKLENGYMNIVNADESQKPLGESKDVYVPLFWLVDKEGVETNYEMVVDKGVLAEIRPATETVINTYSAVKPVEDADIYA